MMARRSRGLGNKGIGFRGEGLRSCYAWSLASTNYVEKRFP